MWPVWSSSDGWWRRAVLASATMGTRLAKLAGRALRPGPPFVRSWVLGEMIAYARGLAPLAPASIRIRCRRYRMAESGQHQYIEVNDDDRTVASAEVTSEGSGGTARASLRAESGHIAPGRRASLVDAVLALPEVQESARLKAAFPLGDSESLQRLQQRCADVRTHSAGWSALLDAKVPSGGADSTAQQSAGEQVPSE